jgi:hypothetical protein
MSWAEWVVSSRVSAWRGCHFDSGGAARVDRDRFRCNPLVWVLALWRYLSFHVASCIDPSTWSRGGDPGLIPRCPVSPPAAVIILSCSDIIFHATCTVCARIVTIASSHAPYCVNEIPLWLMNLRNLTTWCCSTTPVHSAPQSSPPTKPWLLVSPIEWLLTFWHIFCINGSWCVLSEQGVRHCLLLAL